MTKGLTAPISAEDARTLTDRINQAAGDLWRLLLESYEREAWRALGYDSWREYATSEFSMSKSRAYQILAHGELVKALAAEVDPDFSTMVEKLPERVTREIAKVPEQKRAEVAVEIMSTAPVTSAYAAEVAARHTEPPPPEAAAYCPENDAPDPQQEWERAEREVARLQALIEAMEADDKDLEIRKLSARVAGLEGRLSQAIATKNEAVRSAKYANGWLRKIRDELGVQDNADILTAIRR